MARRRLEGRYGTPRCRIHRRRVQRHPISLRPPLEPGAQS
ncbi:Hypothetical protein SLIV_12953 [Streptomyces lividans TK24]|uniref:Uncharacterized protein n=1 Tax=Streptomyces lividans TK24 TaxID=457428 RepID=A0ABX6TP77_STRLI|nr:Hypothetical protein SLIV_12953 [Streptomyces lividans TK24]QSJ09103.1 Hypothetical protein SLIVDG2_12953 [Streptomyces lividans]QTD70027.1 Hypothetical protein SLIVYQS_12953 [Streptomyces lividans TK24] [Streptomyces lividans]